MPGKNRDKMKVYQKTKTKMNINTVNHSWLIKDFEDYCRSDQVIYSKTFGKNGDVFQMKLFPQASRLRRILILINKTG